MLQKLPYADFKFLSQEEILEFTRESILNLGKDDVGYILEVDLEYPKALHDLHDAFPMAPEQIVVTQEMLSKYNKDIIDSMKDINITASNVKNLTPNLMNKTKYVCNILNLQQYLMHGLILKKVHRIISFQQKDHMKSFIELNS